MPIACGYIAGILTINMLINQLNNKIVVKKIRDIFGLSQKN
jgi:hypothetical protein